MKRIVLNILLLMSATLGVQAQQLTANVEETAPGQSWTMTFTLTDAAHYTALSLQLSLPELIQPVEITAGTALQHTHQILMGQPTNGYWDIILYSPQSALLPESDTTFCIRLEAVEKLEDAEYPLSLTNICLADAQGMETDLSDSNTHLVVQNIPTAIQQVRATHNKAEKWYDLRGRHLHRPAKGLLIRHGKKYYIR